MTGEEMEKAIAELIAQQKAAIAQQTKIDNRIEFLVEQQANFQDSLTQLTGVVGKLAEQAEEDRQAVREAFDRFETDIGRLFDRFETDIGRLVDTVESDRETVRTAISALSSAVTEDRKLLREVARLAVASERRLTNLEGRVDRFEGPQQ